MFVHENPLLALGYQFKAKLSFLPDKIKISPRRFFKERQGLKFLQL